MVSTQKFNRFVGREGMAKRIGLWFINFVLGTMNAIKGEGEKQINVFQAIAKSIKFRMILPELEEYNRSFHKTSFLYDK